MKPTQIDLAQAEYYKKFPELIIGLESWETLRFCKSCGGVLEPKDPALYPTTNGFNPFVSYSNWETSNSEGKSVKYYHVCCPHCKKANNVEYWLKKLPRKKGEKQSYKTLDCVVRSQPIPFDVVFRRKVWVEKRKEIKGSWFRKTRYEGEDKFFWEYANSIDSPEISDKTES